MSELGHDFVAYRNHVYRVLNLCVAIVGERVELERVTVAAVFHDLGIWTNKTFDYIEPSVELARQYLTGGAQTDWIPEIEQMIIDHQRSRARRQLRMASSSPFGKRIGLTSHAG